MGSKGKVLHSREKGTFSFFQVSIFYNLAYIPGVRDSLIKPRATIQGTLFLGSWDWSVRGEEVEGWKWWATQWQESRFAHNGGSREGIQAIVGVLLGLGTEVFL